MPLYFISNDITKMNTDAIVNAANSSLCGGGGVDGAIHRAAGPNLLRDCMKLGGCATGSAKITKGYNLPCKYVIHTVGPVWYGGDRGEENLLRRCYWISLKLAALNKCRSVSFPLISSGAYGYPKDQALKIAVEEITAFLQEDDSDMIVNLVFLKGTEIDIGADLQADILKYIDSYSRKAKDNAPCGASANLAPGSRRPIIIRAKDAKLNIHALDLSEAEDLVKFEVQRPALSMRPRKKAAVTDMAACDADSLIDAIGRIDESFSEMLLRKIDESGMTDAQCYKKANIDRKLFSKIRSDKNYRPSKNTAIAFAIALELSLDETKDMLMKAGFALSHSSKFDIIIEYFIVQGNYDINKINEALFAFDQSMLGVL